jgi:hypothetical protein
MHRKEIANDYTGKDAHSTLLNYNSKILFFFRRLINIKCTDNAQC